MRTTLTLERDVAQRIKQEMRRTGKGLKATINDALRRGLNAAGKRTPHARFKVQAHALGVKPGVDLDRMNQLVDELDVEHAAEKLRP